MKKYEIMFIIEPKVENIKDVSERIKNYVTSNEGTIVNEEDMGVKKLQYLVKKREKGHYYLLQMDIDPKKLPEVEKEIKVDEDILKYLLTVAK